MKEKLDFEAAKQKVAERYGYESWYKLFRRYRQSTASNDSGMAKYITEAAEILAQSWANHYVSEDRKVLIGFDEIPGHPGLYIHSLNEIQKRPLPFPETT